ncbi:TPA: hypothetical protein ACHKGZ_004180, partial [Escherichia coli]
YILLFYQSIPMLIVDTLKNIGSPPDSSGGMLTNKSDSGDFIFYVASYLFVILKRLSTGEK